MSNMTRFATGLLLAGLLTSSAQAAEAFTVRLGFVNAHLRELFFGCAENATDKYDRGVDDFAPPPGIATGYIGFFPAEKLPLFYRDIRGLQGPHEWKLYVRVHKDKPVKISWNQDELPKDWHFSIQHGDKTVSMRKDKELTVSENATLTIQAKENVKEDEPETVE